MVSNSRKKDHLPVFGAGPAYVITIVALTIAGIVLSQLGILPYLRIRSTIIVLHSLGTICFIVGIWLWVSAAIKEKLQDKIVANKLVTTGVYSVVRHPIYSAFAFVLTGILLIYSNFYLLLLPFIYWAFLTALMKATEEKWLVDQFGKEYEDYCRQVNRCIPWFPKR